MDWELFPLPNSGQVTVAPMGVPVKGLQLVGLILGLAGCGGGGNGGGGSVPPTPVSISITPTTASVEVGGTQQFTASVSNTTNSAATWQANSVSGGNAKPELDMQGHDETNPPLADEGQSYSLWRGGRSSTPECRT